MELSFGIACAAGLLVLSCVSAPPPRFEGKRTAALRDGNPAPDLTLAANYLRHFYGSREAVQTGRRKRSLSSKLKDMQSFFGLDQSGVLDSGTLAVMKTPRCGVPDVQDYIHNQGNRWTKNVITYSVGKYTSDLPTSTVDSVIASALDLWAKVSSLRFTRSLSQQADIMVEFGSNEHGDAFPFDGPKGTLAHAFDPGEGIGGDVHFDEDELWTAGFNGSASECQTESTSHQRFNLYLVAAHEFGHALGLRHSQNPESLMYPTYRARKTHNLLSSEDIMNINAIYEPGVKRPHYYPRLGWSYPFKPWYTASYFPMAVKDKCSPGLSFDSVTTVGEAIFFFKGGYLWIKHNNKNDVKEGPISNFMPKISSKIDAAYWVSQRATAYLISGSSYWTMKGSRVKGRDRNIRSFGFPAWVEQVDAAVHLHRTVHTLFFTQHLYWKYNEQQKVMEDSYPRNISDDFPGINKPISAAVYKQGFLHFFLGADVCKYDIKRKKVVGVSKANSWLGC
ncbi:matrix metalloproteinase-20 [Brachyhypopomus gauderio]|uniref:matrix metalloproteinase-20 n=1 Tax=Brachyhypopomus gauderio TaxID=698409 RepID=UPI0040412609